MLFPYCRKWQRRRIPIAEGVRSSNPSAPNKRVALMRVETLRAILCEEDLGLRKTTLKKPMCDIGD